MELKKSPEEIFDYTQEKDVSTLKDLVKKMHKETHDAAELDVRFKNWVENGITSYCII